MSSNFSTHTSTTSLHKTRQVCAQQRLHTAPTRKAPHETYDAHPAMTKISPQWAAHSNRTGLPHKHIPVPTRPRVAPMPSRRSNTSLAHGRLSASMCIHSRSSAAREGRPRCNTPPSPASLSAASISCPLRGYVSGGLATPPTACTGAIQENTAESCHSPELLGQALLTRIVCVIYLGEKVPPI
jgi:hypothetical protein